MLTDKKTYLKFLFGTFLACLILYLRESSVHPSRGFLRPKNRVHIRIDGTLDAHAKSENMISLLIRSL